MILHLATLLILTNLQPATLNMTVAPRYSYRFSDFAPRYSYSGATLIRVIRVGVLQTKIMLSLALSMSSSDKNSTVTFGIVDAAAAKLVASSVLASERL